MTHRGGCWRLAHLSDAQLLTSLGAVLRAQRLALAEIIAHLGEVEDRRLHLHAAHGSMFSYCVVRLGMSEDEACRRIELARLARRFPALFAQLATGEITLSVALVLKPVLTHGNHLELLAAARGKSIRQARELVAERFPKPDAPSMIRKLPERRPLPKTELLNASPPVVVPEQFDLPVTPAAAPPPMGPTPEFGGTLTAAREPARTSPTLECGATLTAPREPARTTPTPECGVALTAAPSGSTLPMASPLGSCLPQADATTAFSVCPVDTMALARPAAAPGCEAEQPLSLGSFSSTAYPAAIALPAATERRASGSTPGDRRVTGGARGVIEPLSPQRYRIQFTADLELKKKLELARDLLRHSHPDGDFAPIVSRALDLLLEDIRGRRFGATARRKSQSQVSVQPVATSGSGSPAEARGAVPANSAPSKSDSGHGTSGPAALAMSLPTSRSKQRPHVPRNARRVVLERDGLGCSWTDANGVRCGSRAWLEFDHRDPAGKGGSSAPDNLRLICRAHNGLAAEQAYGREHMQRASARQKKAEPSAGAPA